MVKGDKMTENGTKTIAQKRVTETAQPVRVREIEANPKSFQIEIDGGKIWVANRLSFVMDVGGRKVKVVATDVQVTKEEYSSIQPPEGYHKLSLETGVILILAANSQTFRDYPSAIDKIWDGIWVHKWGISEEESARIPKEIETKIGVRLDTEVRILVKPSEGLVELRLSSSIFEGEKDWLVVEGQGIHVNELRSVLVFERDLGKARKQEIRALGVVEAKLWDLREEQEHAKEKAEDLRTEAKELDEKAKRLEKEIESLNNTTELLRVEE